MKMVRKQIYITEEQDARLKQIAAQRQATEAEVVRAALDALGAAPYVADRRDPLRVSEAAVQERYMTENLSSVTVSADERRIFLDDEAWAEELAFIRGLAKSGKTGRVKGDWRFNREEIYEDRSDEILR